VRGACAQQPLGQPLGSPTAVGRSFALPANEHLPQYASPQTVACVAYRRAMPLRYFITCLSSSP
jgi:hypothetical protein